MKMTRAHRLQIVTAIAAVILKAYLQAGPRDQQPHSSRPMDRPPGTHLTMTISHSWLNKQETLTAMVMNRDPSRPKPRQRVALHRFMSFLRWPYAGIWWAQGPNHLRKGSANGRRGSPQAMTTSPRSVLLRQNYDQSNHPAAAVRMTMLPAVHLCHRLALLPN